MIDRRAALAVPLAILLSGAPLMFGSTSRPAALILALASSALALAALASGARPHGWGWMPMGLLLLLGCLQMVPLPAWLLARLSPAAAAFHALLPGSSGGTTPAGEPSWRSISLDPEATWMSLLLLGSAACVFAVARHAAEHPAGRRIVTLALAGSGLFQAVYGLAEHLSGRHAIFGWPRVHYLDSASGTFINRNHFAGYLEMTLILCLGLLLSLRSSAAAGQRAPRRRTAPGDRASGRAGWMDALIEISTPRGGWSLLLAAAACLMATALLLSRSRAGAASAAAGLVVLVSLVWRPGRDAGRPFAAGLVLAALSIGILYAAMAGPEPLASRYARVGEDLAGGGGRLPLWRDAARMAADFLPAGAGMGTFERVFPAMRISDGAQLYRHAHNDYLEAAAETGLPGLALSLALPVLFLASALPRAAARPADTEDGIGWSDERLQRGLALSGAAAVAALATHSLFDFNLHVPANLVTVAALGAVALPSGESDGTSRLSRFRLVAA